MNIEEIRAEIPKAYTSTYCMKRWLHENGVEDAYSMAIPDVIPAIARTLVDMAYEAGKAQGHFEERIENRKPIEDAFNAGFEAGKAEIPECLECKSGDYEKGFNKAAKDPKAWYVLDKNGNAIHLGDRVKNAFGERIIKSIEFNTGGRVFLFFNNNGWDYADEVEKVEEMNVYSPNHYNKDTADDIEKVIEGLPSKEAAQLYNVLKYFDRRDKKGHKEDDLKKANNSAHRLVFGEWRNNADRLRPMQGEEIQQRSEATERGKAEQNEA